MGSTPYQRETEDPVRRAGFRRRHRRSRPRPRQSLGIGLGKAAGDCQRVPLSRVDEVPGLDDDPHLVPAVQRQGRRAEPFDGVPRVDGCKSVGVLSAVGGLDRKVEVVDDAAGAADRHGNWEGLRQKIGREEGKQIK